MKHPVAKRRTPLAQRMIRERASKGWTQRELARHSDISHVTIANLERGYHGEVFASTLYKLGEAIGVDGGELYDLFLQSTGETRETKENE